MTNTFKFWASFKNARKRITLGPFTTRQGAVVAAIRHKPRPWKGLVMTGYGSLGPHFDVRWETVEPYNVI